MCSPLSDWIKNDRRAGRAVPRMPELPPPKLPPPSCRHQASGARPCWATPRCKPAAVPKNYLLALRALLAGIEDC